MPLFERGSDRTIEVEEFRGFEDSSVPCDEGDKRGDKKIAVEGSRILSRVSETTDPLLSFPF